MTSLWFAHPAWLLPGVALVALLGAALLAAFALARRRARVLLGRSDTVGKSVAIRDATFWLAALALVVAGLGPRLAEQTVQVTSSGVDLVILVDVSRSMDAADVAPSRLDRARRAAQEILGRMPPESRSALAAFAGRGVLFTPLTPDHQALAEMLPAVETGLIRPGGSSLALGVEAAVSAYEAGSERPRVLFVLSDGESRSASGEVDEALLQRARVRVLAAPQGSPLGATIPDHGTPLRDSAGEIVVSRRHDAPLVRLSEISGGAVFLPDEWGEFDVDAAMSMIHRDVLPADGGFVERAVTVPVVVPFAGIAFVLLLLEAAWGSRWPGRRRAQRALRAAAEWGSRRWQRSLRVAVLLPVVLLAGADAGRRADPTESPDEPSPADTIAALEAQARGPGLDAVELVTLGVARASIGLVDEADQAFRAAALQAEEPAVAARAYHDLGVSALARGDLEAARDAFFDALALAAEAGHRGTTTDETRFNLEWTLAALSSPDPEEKPLPRRPRPDDAGERQKPKDREEPQLDAEAPEPQLDPAAQPAQADPSAQPAAEEPPPAPSGLSRDETQRWLERVEDDPARALRSATEPTGRGRRNRGRGPTW